MSDRVFFPNLDGLRFFAFLSVFFAHSFYSEIPEVINSDIYHAVKSIAVKGILGVNFFFVLSGFLITYLLLDEKRINKAINIRFFYVRRILRIWPLYFVVVFIGFVLIPAAMEFLGENYQENSKLYLYLLFINNMSSIVPATAVLGVLWSIAIEEQFYLFWPIVVEYVKRQFLNWFFFTLVLISFVYRVFYPSNNAATLFCISDMALGGWIAFLAITKHPLIYKIATIPRWSIIGIYVLGFLSILTLDLWHNHTVAPFTRLIFGCYFGFIIIDQCYGIHSFFKMSRFKFATKWGKYTYGLYMLHFPVVYVCGKLFRNFYTRSLFDVLIVETLVTFLLSLLVAFLSYRFFESRFLRLKDRFSYY
jgi:peptidoglycan/LPS O-acetylase OafA/YrhL